MLDWIEAQLETRRGRFLIVGSGLTYLIVAVILLNLLTADIILSIFLASFGTFGVVIFFAWLILPFIDWLWNG